MENLDPKENIGVFNIGPDEKDRLQKMIMANVVYIIKDNKVLMMVHTKSHSVTGGKHIGVGGKYAMKSFYGYESEKIPTKEMFENIMMGQIPIEDPILGLYREINEESGLDLSSEEIRTIGFSHIKKNNEKVNEVWNIVSYIVDEYKGEINIDELNKNSKEGIFKFIKLEDMNKVDMWPADRIIFNNREKNRNIYVEAIYDSSNGGKLRYVSNDGKKDGYYSSTYILVPDLLKPKEYIGEELKIDSDSLEKSSIVEMYTKNGNSIDKLINSSELKTMAYLPDLKSTINEFRYPIKSNLLGLQDDMLRE